MNLPKWFDSVLDVIARQRATGDPLKNVANTVFRGRKLGSSERQQASALLYNFVRNGAAIIEQVQAELKKSGGMTPVPRELDRRALVLLMNENPPTPFEKGGALGRLPGWFRGELEKAYGDHAEELADALAQRAHPVLAVDRRFASIEDAKTALADLGAKIQESPLINGAIRVESHYVSLKDLPPKLQRAIWLMDDGSQLVAAAINAKPGEKVLDMCAGGGGKTRYLLQTGASITAADISSQRIEDAKERAKDKNVHFMVGDARALPLKPETFDWVLIDSPCSGTGTLRRSPDLILRLKPENVDEFVILQRELLLAGSKLLKPGGTLVYATCSVLPKEGQEIADYGLKQGLKAKPLQALLGTACKIKLDSSAYQLQLLPSVHGCDGFYLAAFGK